MNPTFETQRAVYIPDSERSRIGFSEDFKFDLRQRLKPAHQFLRGLFCSCGLTVRTRANNLAYQLRQTVYGTKLLRTPVERVPRARAASTFSRAFCFKE
jgi:hypothetical protein